MDGPSPGMQTAPGPRCTSTMIPRNPEDWSDWRWQLRRSARDFGEIADWLDVEGPSARDGWAQRFEVGVTPFFASLCTSGDIEDPLARQILPLPQERVVSAFELADPLGEEVDRVAPGVIHKYPDRVLLLVTDTCASYCRYCTRSRWVATNTGTLSGEKLDAALDWIATHEEVRDVLISGGDPLLLSDRRLASLLSRLCAIPHLRFVRIGTRVPVFLPMRVTEDLASILKPRRIPIFVNVHINHFRELAPEVVAALARLADAGVPLGGQAVLLRGVNDSAEVLKETFYAMLSARVRPYYLFHCDPVRGTSHLRVPVEEGLELMRELIGHTSGMAVPKYVIDLPSAGKVPIWPDYVQSRDRHALQVRAHDGSLHNYPAR